MSDTENDGARQGGALDQHLDEALDELAKHYSGREFAAAEYGVKLLYKRLDAERSEQESDDTPQSGIDSSIIKALHTSAKGSLGVESLRDVVNDDIPYLKVTCGNVRQRADEMVEFNMLQMDDEHDERRYKLAHDIGSEKP